jgi:WD repeat-containing protein 89
VDDEDTCDLAEIKRHFTAEYTTTLQENVSLKESYILHLSANKEFDKIAIGSSTGQISMFDLQTSAMTTTNSCLYDEHFENPICGLKYFNGDSNLIVAAAEDGIIKMYDLRTNQKICSLEDNTDGKRKTVTSMDLNQNNRVLCAGTDKIQSDAYLLFFDLRERVLMGAYADSHSDDITNVRFHPENADSLASCSTDGLINVFDISQASEDDAFMYCMNTESSAAIVNWHKDAASKKDLLTCITHTHDLHLYDVEEQELLVEFARDKVTQAIKRKSVADCNLINCHNEKDGTMFVLATSNFNKG